MHPSVVLINPKYPHNVGSALRACAAFGVTRMRWTGDRVRLDSGRDTRLVKRVSVVAKHRLPREERMKGYLSVEWKPADATTVLHDIGGTPVAVEIAAGAQPLPVFDHPEDAVYVFGPEDGSIPKAIRHACHRFVVIPTAHCLNLAAAVNVVLYDRRSKRIALGIEPMAMTEVLEEERGWIGHTIEPHEALGIVGG